MTDDEKTLVALETKLGITPRRELKQQLEMVKRDLVQTEQLFNSLSNDPRLFHLRIAYLLAKRQTNGMITKNFED